MIGPLLTRAPELVMLPLLMMLRLLVTVPPNSLVSMPEVGRVMVPDVVIMPAF